jgi:hypothetical protein
MAHEHEHLSDDQQTSTTSGSVFGTFGLEDLLNLLQADQFFFAELDPLNNSGAEGAALLALNGDQLTVITAATGVEPGEVHPQHIHGFEDGRESNVPTLRQDDDTDGFVELTEGQETYGPVLLSLTSPAGGELSGFPTPEGDAFLFVETYDLSDAASAPMGAELLEAPLTSREIVLHGITLAEGQGETNAASSQPNEADGIAGYKAVLPIAAGEIEALDPEDGLTAFSSFVFGGQSDFFV